MSLLVLTYSSVFNKERKPKKSPRSKLRYINLKHSVGRRPRVVVNRNRFFSVSFVFTHEVIIKSDQSCGVFQSEPKPSGRRRTWMRFLI